MIVQIDIPDYRGEGLKLEWEDIFTISASIDSVNNYLSIIGDTGGLISLARHLLTLAQPSVPSGHHIHLDENNSLEAGSCEIIIAKL